MIMRWGLQKADEMGVEFWLDATVRGKPLYESHGFGSVLKNVLTVDNSGANEGWKRLDRVMNEDPMTMWVMWRPIGGVFEVDEKGERVRPWEKEEGWVESEGYELLKSQKI